MEKQRIQVYADPGIKRRIELAAAKYNVPVTEYCLSAIEQQLADDDLLEAEQITIPVTPSDGRDDDLITDLRALRERILARRGGRLIDMDIVEQVRAERDDELTDLH
jgi:hypothetical protein